MPTFLVDVCRTTNAFHTVEVEAENVEAATESALDDVSSLNFRDREHAHSVLNVRRLNDQGVAEPCSLQD